MKAAVAFSLLIVGAIALPRNDLNWDLFDEEGLHGFEKRIVGGEEAAPHEFPYQVGLRTLKVKDYRVYRTWCGAALISDKVVITAAHCLDNAASTIVYLGAHDHTESFEINREMIQVKSKNFIMHENYNRQLSENDIGLILLPQKVELNKYINIVKLPKASQTDLVGRMTTASGWGKTSDHEPSSDVLRFVQRRVLENEACHKFFGPIIKSQICVDGSDRKATCEGDSGGPLVIEEDGSKVIVGLTSFGGPSCEIGMPVVFTRVSSFLDWINKHSGISIET